MTCALRLALLLFFSFICTQGWTKTVSLVTEKRPFALSLLGGLSESRVLNTDGSYAPYRGPSLGVEATFRLITLEQAEFHFFGRYFHHMQKGKNNSDDELVSGQTLIGFKTFIGPFFYMGAGYGTNKINLQTNTTDFTVNTLGPSLGMGLEFNISTDLFMGLNFWYSNAPIKFEPPLSSNSFLENGAFYLSLVWSPSINAFEYFYR